MKKCLVIEGLYKGVIILRMKLLKVYFLFWILFVGFTRRIKSRNTIAFDGKLGFLESIDSLSLVIAHPDDEVMFFAPSLLEFDSRLPSNVEFNIVCLSKGGADGLDETRVDELQQSINLLLANSRRQHYLHQYDYPDGHEENWDKENVELTIRNSVVKGKGAMVLLSFDDRGVSRHVNHIACYEAVSNLFQNEANVKAVLYLDSYGGNIILKYSAFFWEIWKLVKDWLVHQGLPKLWEKRKEDTTVTLMSSYFDYVLSFASMSHAHQSQMVWFRYFWWTFSRFVFVNDLKVVNK